MNKLLVVIAAIGVVLSASAMAQDRLVPRDNRAAHHRQISVHDCRKISVYVRRGDQLTVCTSFAASNSD